MDANAIGQHINAIGDALLEWDRYAHANTMKTYDVEVRSLAEEGGGILAFGSMGYLKSLSAHEGLQARALRAQATAQAEPLFAFIRSLPGVSYEGHFTPVGLYLSKVVTTRPLPWRVGLSIHGRQLLGYGKTPYHSLAHVTKGLVKLREQLALFDWSGDAHFWQTRSQRETKSPTPLGIPAPDVCLAHILSMLLGSPTPDYADLIHLHTTKLWRSDEDTFQLPEPHRMKALIQTLRIPMPDDERYVDPYADI